MSESVPELVARALAEDVGTGDLTSEATVPAELRARARIVQKQPGVVFGLDVAREAFAQTGVDAFEPLVAEGVWRDDVTVEIAAIDGQARALLAAERTALNFLCHLSGVATMTARYVMAVAGTGVTILDTRKTTPGLRALEKAAVVAGGGVNHRLGLDDAILIKENHVAAAGGLRRAVELAAAAQPQLPVEVECRNADEVVEALASGAQRLLLDNMSDDELRAAVAARDAAGSAAKLEASGGITLANVAAVAATGVEFISIGALTHSAPVLDLSLLLDAG
jgi:nicotinate-nucleotide pyrophosphorylase (carboxylating)